MMSLPMRVSVYASIGLISFLMLLAQSPISNPGTWIGALIMVCFGLWIEMSGIYDELDEYDENDESSDTSQRTNAKDDKDDPFL